MYPAECLYVIFQRPSGLNFVSQQGAGPGSFVSLYRMTMSDVVTRVVNVSPALVRRRCQAAVPTAIHSTSDAWAYMKEENTPERGMEEKGVLSTLERRGGSSTLDSCAKAMEVAMDCSITCLLP